MSIGPIDFIDLKAQRRRIGQRMDDAILAAVHEGAYILGPQVKKLEAQLAEFAGIKHAIGCANGTDAILLALKALGIGAGDAVICPSFTFAATAEVVALAGATPIFVDVVEATYNIDPDKLPEALALAKSLGLKPRAVIPVDLFGQPAEYDRIEAFTKEHDLALIADSAQGFGALYHGRRAGSIGTFATASFFPAKPLGCYGDGGAVFTNDDRLADLVRSFQVHGKGSDKYDNIRIGVNSRLDTLQAAVLIEKLAVYPDEIEKRQVVAERYNRALANVAVVPHVPEGLVSIWAQYTIRVPAERRAKFIADMKAKGVPTAIYYPKPLHQQTAYKDYPIAGGTLPVSDRIAGEVVALPMHAYLDEATQDHIIAAARESLLGSSLAA